jgi:hypothetical protein
MRYPESFPDVRLVKSINDENPVIGIELKGWYLLSKEKEPSFRYKASADAMTEYDILACYPWALSSVISGSPRIYEPYIEQAKYAANMRTFYWQVEREVRGENQSREIFHPETEPYPRPGSNYIDVPEYDGGGNFGRLARGQYLMKSWCNESLETKLGGIEARYWISFFAAFIEGKTQSEIEHKLSVLEGKIRDERTALFDTRAEILEHIKAILDLV